MPGPAWDMTIDVWSLSLLTTSLVLILLSSGICTLMKPGLDECSPSLRTKERPILLVLGSSEYLWLRLFVQSTWFRQLRVLTC